MTRPEYNEKLSFRDIIGLLDSGAYRVCLDTGQVWGRSKAKPLATYEGNDEGHLFVRLYCQPKEKALAVSRLVWVAGTRAAIPRNFEIHHRNLNVKDNRFENLYALHKVDHAKLHGQDLIESEVPF